MATCPAGHPTTALDYCDVCGVPVEAGSSSGTPGAAGARAAGASAAPAGTLQPCPSCDSPNAADALFCEVCGYDFTTGSMPRPLTPPDQPATGPDADGDAATAVRPAAPGIPAGAVPAGAGASGPPAPGPGTGSAAPSAKSWVVEIWIDPAWYAEQESPDPLPSAGLPLVRPLEGPSLLVGRTSQSRGIHPDIDCQSDSGVSRRHCQLSTDGARWWVEDLDSANGTFVGRASGPLPEDPLTPGVRQELRPDDRVYVGAWTRLVIRAATDEERVDLG